MAKKMKNEVKIGLMVVATLTMFVLGFNYLRGSGLFSTDQEFYTYYDNVQGLQESAVVQLKGFAIGKVSNIELQDDQQIKVTFLVKKGIKIPVGSNAQLASADLISGTKIITLNLADSVKKYYKEHSFIAGKPAGGLLDNLSDQVSPLVGVMQHTVISLDTLLNSVNQVINHQTRQHLNASFASLDIAMTQLSALSTQLNAQSGQIAGVLQNANSITGNLASSNERISNTLGNLETFSTTLNNAPIQQTLADLQAAVENVQGIISKINTSEGTMGLLMSDKQLYHNLTGTLGSLDTLLGDLKEHPSRYINISVFGRKVKD